LLAKSTKASVIQEKQMLQQELDVAREQLKHLQKHHDEFEMKSKTDMKLLIKEVKSLRSSQLELKQQLSELMEEKVDVEVWSFLVLICYNYELIILDIYLN
jgi:uncharacterized membrane protein (DUF106 family)